MSTLKNFMLLIFSLLSFSVIAQPPQGVHWAKDGNNFYQAEDNQIEMIDLNASRLDIIVTSKQLTPAGASNPLRIRDFFFSNDASKVLIYTNSKKVWRYDTRGDYWYFDLKNHKLQQIGKGMHASSLMFAKFSPDDKKVAYVSNYNIYVEDLATGKINALTKNGTRELINGTFDWVYEEEFFCKDGFRWSPDSKKIAYWQIDAKNTKDYLMIDNTDSIYPFTKPVEYPIAGQAPLLLRSA